MDAKSCLVYSLAIMLLLAVAGCVAPPAENSTAAANLYNFSKPGATSATPTPAFVSEVTLAGDVPTTIQPAGFSTVLPATPIPSDITCRIYQKNLPGFNSTAIVFDLKNPPMYINYTVFPYNQTFNRTYTNTYTKKDETLVYSDYSTQSWFEVTVFNDDTNEEYLKDGFGQYHGLSLYKNRTLKILKSGKLRIEFKGNYLKDASASVWVKPIGNFEESRYSEFSECMYWDQYRDTLPTAVTTTIKGAIYTWTPENKVTPKK